MEFPFRSPLRALEDARYRAQRSHFRLFAFLLATAEDQTVLRTLFGAMEDIHFMTGEDVLVICPGTKDRINPQAEPRSRSERFAQLSQDSVSATYRGDLNRFISDQTRESYALARALRIPFDRLPAIVFLNELKKNAQSATWTITQPEELVQDFRRLLAQVRGRIELEQDFERANAIVASWRERGPTVQGELETTRRRLEAASAALELHKARLLRPFPRSDTFMNSLHKLAEEVRLDRSRCRNPSRLLQQACADLRAGRPVSRLLPALTKHSAHFERTYKTRNKLLSEPTMEALNGLIRVAREEDLTAEETALKGVQSEASRLRSLRSSISFLENEVEEARAARDQVPMLRSSLAGQAPLIEALARAVGSRVGNTQLPPAEELKNQAGKQGRRGMHGQANAPKPTILASGEASMDPTDTNSGIRRKADVAIVTIKEEEFEAALAAFAFSNQRIELLSRGYCIGSVPMMNGQGTVDVAITRCPSQGNGVSQDVARDLLADLDPAWVLVVGIAGATPSSEICLGDVALAGRVLDFSVEAVKRSGSEFALSEVPVHFMADNLLTVRAAWEPQLGDWCGTLPDYPGVEIRDDRVAGSDAWQADVREALERWLGRAVARPRARVVTIGSSDRLIKNDELLAVVLRVARQIRAVEMESAGVHIAARGRGEHRRAYPVLSVRGISDVVGFKRDEDWTLYACSAAAAYAAALVRSGVLHRGTPQGQVEQAGTENREKPSDSPSARGSAQLLSAMEDGIPLRIEEEVIECLKHVASGGTLLDDTKANLLHLLRQPGQVQELSAPIVEVFTLLEDQGRRQEFLDLWGSSAEHHVRLHAALADYFRRVPSAFLYLLAALRPERQQLPSHLARGVLELFVVMLNQESEAGGRRLDSAELSSIAEAAAAMKEAEPNTANWVYYRIRKKNLVDMGSGPSDQVTDPAAVLAPTCVALVPGYSEHFTRLSAAIRSTSWRNCRIVEEDAIRAEFALMRLFRESTEERVVVFVDLTERDPSTALELIQKLRQAGRGRKLKPIFILYHDPVKFSSVVCDLDPGIQRRLKSTYKTLSATASEAELPAQLETLWGWTSEEWSARPHSSSVDV